MEEKEKGIGKEGSEFKFGFWLLDVIIYDDDRNEWGSGWINEWNKIGLNYTTNSMKLRGWLKLEWKRVRFEVVVVLFHIDESFTWCPSYDHHLYKSYALQTRQNRIIMIPSETPLKKQKEPRFYPLLMFLLCFVISFIISSLNHSLYTNTSPTCLCCFVHFEELQPFPLFNHYVWKTMILSFFSLSILQFNPIFM